MNRIRAEVSRTEPETANRTRDVFLAAVAHELRRPLTAILGWTRMLRHGDSTDIDRGLEIIERSAKNQQLLIEELLDVSRIATQFRVTLSVIAVNEVLRDVADEAMPAATDRDVQIISNLVPQPTLVLGDALRLQQIVGNLVANAIKFTPDGGRVTLTLEHTGLHAQIEVADNGIGIERSFLPRIFEPFVQADTYPSRSAGGLGLGLAIVRHLVELHGGTIEAQSEGPGRGTRMIVRLPLAPAGAVESAIG